MQGVRTLQALLKALSPGTRQNSLHLCLPFSFCLFKSLSLDLFLLFFSVVLFPFLSSTFFLSHESLPVLLPSVSHAHFFFSSPSISFLSSTLPPKKRLSLPCVLLRHVLSDGPPSPGTGEALKQTGCSDSKEFYSSRHLLPSVPLSKGLTESFREDRKQDKGPTEMLRRVHAQCVIPFSKWFTRGQMPAKSVREPSTGSEG